MCKHTQQKRNLCQAAHFNCMFFLQLLQNAFAGIFQSFTIPNVKADSKMVNLPYSALP